MAFRFKDKERPRGYTSKVAGLLHVGSLVTTRYHGHAARACCLHWLMSPRSSLAWSAPRRYAACEAGGAKIRTDPQSPTGASIAGLS